MGSVNVGGRFPPTYEKEGLARAALLHIFLDVLLT